MSCCDSKDRLCRLEAEYERLRLEVQHLREIRQTENFIDSYFHNTVNELHREKEETLRAISTDTIYHRGSLQGTLEQTIAPPTTKIF